MDFIKLLFISIIYFPPLNYFFPKFSFMWVGFIGVLFFITFSKKTKIHLLKSDVIILICTAIMALLSCALYVFGTNGPVGQRPLFIYFLLQFMLVLVIVSSRGEAWSKFLFKAIASWFVVQILVIIAQYSHSMGGPGLSLDETSYSWVVAEGTTKNPNNTAVYITIFASVLILFSHKYYIKYLALFAVVTATFSLILFASRMALLSFTIFILAYISQILGTRSRKEIRYFLSLIVISSIALTLTYTTGLYQSSAFTLRSFDKIATITTLTSSDSANFRLLSVIRLTENLTTLGIGSLSDLNYFRYYEYYDPSLININPHFFIAEYSFLFGYLGFITSITLVMTLTYKLLKNNSVSLMIRMSLIVILVTAQLVPASILNMPLIFPILLIAAVTNFSPIKDPNKITK